ncbi:MAG: PTS sugar transporter subunit IIA [Candidatus Latescibacterota bacterium]|nr:MAG: PTS sugar transporter subunit IIA [Candidatus Latescibacterota bacterium]RKY71203.1 MAG: PTS sugar transporter subunit IIA [Candidatus Latescibacterota bacterium]HDH99957.1 PTS sugar transporter subunit IIA [Bacillota bacterium]
MQELQAPLVRPLARAPYRQTLGGSEGKMNGLSDLISPDRIVWLSSDTKEEVLRELVDVISRAPQIGDRDELLKAVLEREKIMSTGIGLGIAVPHAKIESVSDFVIAIGISRKGVEFDSLDNKPVHIVVMIAGPADQQDRYIRILAKVVLALKDPKVRETVLKAETPQEVLRALS